jgi:hypothetical protein
MYKSKPTFHVKEISMKHVFVAIVLFVALLFLNMPKIALAQATTAPETTITSGPSETVNSTTAKFEFSSDQNVAKFECKLDEPPGAFEDCTSPQEYNGLSEGSHTFEVKASGDPTPASRTWTVSVTDTTAPETTITSGPSETVNSTTAKFEFSSDESDAKFQCRLDNGAFESCTSPKEYNELSEGFHTFDVQATDTAGNTDPTPASYKWTVDITGLAGDLVLPDALTWLMKDPVDWKTGLALFLGGLIAAGATVYSAADEILFSKKSKDEINLKEERYQEAMGERKEAEKRGAQDSAISRKQNEEVSLRKELDKARSRASTRATGLYVLIGVGSAVVFAGDIYQAILIGAGGPAFLAAIKQRAQLSKLAGEKDAAQAALVEKEKESANIQDLLNAQGKTDNALEELLRTMVHEGVTEIQSSNGQLQGRLRDARGALEGVLEDWEEGETGNALLRRRLDEVRATLEQVGEQQGIDEGERRSALGEGPTDDEGGATQGER